MSTIKGVWVFNETPDLSGYLPVGVLANFTSSKQSFLGFHCDMGPFDYIYGIEEIDIGGGEIAKSYNTTISHTGDRWVDEAYRTIDFGETEQIVDDDFYAWFTANATEQIPYEPTYSIKTETLVGIGNAIREKTGTSTKYTPAEMAQAIGSIESGGGGYTQEEMDQAVAAATEAGKQAESDRFRDSYQTSLDGNYGSAFGSFGWTDETYNPKYAIVCNKGNAEMAFRNAQITTTKVPIEIRVASAGMMFSNCKLLKTIPYMGFFGVTNTGSIFSGCYELENVTFGGEITTGFGFGNCSKLTNASVQSYIDHLVDLTGQTSQKVVFHSSVGNKLTDVQKATFTAKNYTVVY